MNDRELLENVRMRALADPRCRDHNFDPQMFLDELHYEEPKGNYPNKALVGRKWSSIVILGVMTGMEMLDGTWAWKDRNPDTPIPLLDEALRSTGAKIVVLERENRGAAAGHYSTDEDIVFLPPFRSYKSAEHAYASAFHEIAHWTGHSRRLNRGLEGGPLGVGPRGYGVEEMTADMTATLMLSDFDMLDATTLAARAYYVGGYWLDPGKCNGRRVDWNTAVEQALEAATYLRTAIMSNSRMEVAA